ncbi:MAG TPA: hypothetical protein VGM64_02220 [Lacunisphaera sp.]|jgi:spermidine synthase
MKSTPHGSLVSATILNGRAVAFLFFVSGAVALVYEAVWQRQFALLFGSAAPATAAVLGGYFAGLGTGAFVIGRIADRWPRPLLAYALFEMSIGLGALLVSPLLSGFDLAYPWLFKSLAGRPELFVAVRTAVAFFVILIPTFCMGGTLPLLGQMVDRGQRRLGQTAGWLYVVNTMGAGLGVLAVPFLLLPRLGLNGTVWLCAVINGLLALAAWWLGRCFRLETRGLPFFPIVERKKPRSTKPLTAHQPVTVLALISGMVTFALQVLWNRAFAQVHENSMYSFSVIAAVVIFALALGAQVARISLRHDVEPHRLIGTAWVFAGGAIASGPWLFLGLSDDLSYLSAAGGWTAHSFHLVGLAAAMLVVPIALLGTALPALMEQVGRVQGRETASVLGRLLATNIVGTIAGALVAGFLLPHWLGLWTSIIWLGALVLAVGLWQRRKWTTPRSQGKMAFVFIGIWLAVLWPIAKLDLPRVRLALDEDEHLVALTEGTHGITAVVERPGSRRLKLNNHYGLGGTASTGDERMQAHLPLLLHPAPRRVAFLGLGTAITAGGALFHPVDEVTVMELVPEVVSASRDYFREANQGVLDDMRTRVVMDDARHYLRGSGAHFDVIIGDLVVPWRQGEGSLFTLEQFRAARDALAPGGLFCQWLPLFQLSEVEVNILTRTFLTVFPQAQIWRGDFSPTEPAIALIGSAGDLKLDVGQVRRRLAEMKLDSTNPQLQSTDAFWMNFVGFLETADVPAGETRLNREDRPWIELLGPMLHTEGNDRSLFTGRQLQAWLDQVTQRSQSQLAQLPARELSAVKAGRVLGEMTMCLSENNRAGAIAAKGQLQQMLSAETFRLLF